MYDEPYWTDKFGVGYDEERTTLLKAPEDIKEYVIPEGVVEIAEKAFFQTEIESITFPSSLYRIGYKAFYLCKRLKSLDFSDGVPSIGDKAFAYCTSLKELGLHDDLDVIGDGAFAYCFNLKSIVVSDTYTDITRFLEDDEPEPDDDDDYFGIDHYDEISELKMYTKLEAYNKSKTILFSVPNDVEEYIIPDTVKVIAKQAFSYCRKLKSITIPNGITRIEEETFMGCVSLSEVHIPESVERICDRAFAACSSLEEVIIPNNTVLEEHVFIFCFSLRRLNLPDKETLLEYIFILDKFYNTDFITMSHSNMTASDDYFYGKTETVLSDYENLEAYNHSKTTLFSVPQDTEEEYIIPDTVVKIYDEAFHNCKKIKSITLPNTIQEFGELAFEYCDALEELKIHYVESDTVESFDCDQLNIIDVFEANK